MAFTFQPIKGTEYLKDVYPRINSLGISSAQMSRTLDDISSQLKTIQTYTITDSDGRTKEDLQINPDSNTGYMDIYGSLVSPPNNERTTGWVTLKVTPSGNASLIFHPDYSEKTYKKIKKDGIWTDWIQYLPSKELNKYIPGNILNDGYFDFTWSYGANTLEQELESVPQGLSTFYATQYMTSSKFPEPVRGTILKEKVYGGSVCIVRAVGDSGKDYIIQVSNGVAKPVQQTLVSVDLWKGNQDLAIKTTNKLKDSVSNYDYIECYVEFYAGGANVTKVPTRLSTVYFRDLNLSNNNSSTAFDLFEGGISIDSSGTTFTPYLCKRVTGSRVDWDVTGIINIVSITGIKQI